MVPVIEETTRPLLMMVNQIETIEFDDDILFFLSSLLKKKKSTDSQLIRDAFQFLPLFHRKYSYIFGPLLECLSNYMMFSSINELNIDFIASSIDNLSILIKMGSDSLMPPSGSTIDEPSLEYSQDGAVLFQLMFQNLSGPLVIEMIHPVLEVVWQKLILPETESPTLTRSLFNVFLAASLQDVDKVLQFLESKGLILDFLYELIDAN